MAMSRWGATIDENFQLPELSDPTKKADLILWGDGYDSMILGDIVAYGYFLVILAQVIGYVLDDKANAQNLILDLVGGLLYISVGSIQIQHFSKMKLKGSFNDLVMANASLAIIQGFVLLVDSAFCGLRLLKGD